MSRGVLQATLHIAFSLTLAEAMELLDSLDETYLKEIVYRNYNTAPPIAFRTLEWYSDPMEPCSQIGPIWFEGGPPGHRDWIDGMVSQYVADRILYAMTERGERIVAAKIDAILRHGIP